MLNTVVSPAMTAGAEMKQPLKKTSRVKTIMKRLYKNKSSILGLVIICIFVLIAVFGPALAPYGPAEIDMENVETSPSAAHICGTDDLGRDILSRLMVGTRYSLGLGLGAVAFGLIFGILLGSIAGFFGGKVETIIMRIFDMVQAIPSILLAIIISAVLGNGFLNTIIALGIGRVTHVGRMIRAQFLSLREQEYVEAAHAMDCSVPRLIFKHILPNAVSPLIVTTTMGIGNCIMSAAQLSYLGLGIQPPTPEWGAMLSGGREFIRYSPHIVLFPGLCIAIVVLAFNLFGDGLRDALDPKLKH